MKFKCKECNVDFPKWAGRCSNCNAWNSLVEIADVKGKQGIAISGPVSTPTSIGDILEMVKANPEKRHYEFSSPTLNDFWNKGLISGSFLLLAGEPGLGKSTIALQILRSLYEKNKNQILYITAEESLFELARRADRLGINKEILLLQTNNFEQIEKTLIETKPAIVVLDSVQTFYSSEMQSSPGSIMQVSYLASQLLSITKNYNISIILIGHVTKDGSIAGPKTLEHLVDSVLLLERSDVSNYRTLMFSKHRYGATDSQLLLKMEEKGMEIVSNPSLALLENLETGIGVCYGMAIEKSLPFVVEIQVLVSKPSKSEESYGRREAINLKMSKLNTIIAIAEKYLGIYLRSRDVYVQISGLAKNLTDDSLDLPILLAIISSINNKLVENLFGSKTTKDKKPIFAGRLTLSGQIRNPTNDKERTKTAGSLGFDYNPQISFTDINKLISVKAGS